LKPLPLRTSLTLVYTGILAVLVTVLANLRPKVGLVVRPLGLVRGRIEALDGDHLACGVQDALIVFVGMLRSDNHDEVM